MSILKAVFYKNDIWQATKIVDLKKQKTAIFFENGSAIFSNKLCEKFYSPAPNQERRALVSTKKISNG